MLLIVVTLSIKRYIAVCRPFSVSKLGTSSKSQTIVMNLIIWTAGYLIILPGCLYVGSKTTVIDNSTRIVCSSGEGVGRSLLHVVPLSLFFISLFLISITYTLIGLALRKSAETMSHNNNEFSNCEKKRSQKMLCE